MPTMTSRTPATIAKATKVLFKKRKPYLNRAEAERLSEGYANSLRSTILFPFYTRAASATDALREDLRKSTQVVMQSTPVTDEMCNQMFEALVRCAGSVLPKSMDCPFEKLFKPTKVWICLAVAGRLVSVCTFVCFVSVFARVTCCGCALECRGAHYGL
eukprot:TRINITY_DN46814_c0_g1_i1.p1 TRINITY_DN46814_c0_g1~~TRINITY_DN46814_c0_g1_i1.p1  ORF type:complete len:159 (+),score=11.25 TRINITY_DN46814_c0_g1_i1:231-707(+)